MAPFRVTQEFALPGDPPTQAAAVRLRGRLHEAAPDSHAAVALGIGRVHVSLTLDADDAASAVALAIAAARTVFGASATRITVEPVGQPTRV